MSYRVSTQVYSGPFDLLLQLVSRQKVDIGSISISEVAEQYLAEVERLSGRSIQSTLDEVDEDLEEERELISTDEGSADVGATFDGDSFDGNRDA